MTSINRAGPSGGPAPRPKREGEAMNLLSLPARAVPAVLAAALVAGCGARERPADRKDGTGTSDEAPPAHKGTEATMKTIGVLGGLGPQATMDFEARIHRMAQR